jgi:hypothetical protein
LTQMRFESAALRPGPRQCHGMLFVRHTIN